MQPLTQAQRQLITFMGEAELQRLIVGLAKQCGWEVHHQFDSRHSESGWPDLYMIRDRRALAWELKQEKDAAAMRWQTDDWITDQEVKVKFKIKGNQPRLLRFAKQIRTLLRLRRSGTEARIIRPRDWFTGYVEDRLK